MIEIYTRAESIVKSRIEEFSLTIPFFVTRDTEQNVALLLSTRRKPLSLSLPLRLAKTVPNLVITIPYFKALSLSLSNLLKERIIPRLRSTVRIYATLTR